MTNRTQHVPLFIVCKNPTCRRVKAVKRRGDQRRQQYCSQACGSACTNRLTRAARSRGGLVSAERRRARRLASLKDLTPIEIFRMAYSRGWKSGVRAAARRAAVAQA